VVNWRLALAAAIGAVFGVALPALPGLGWILALAVSAGLAASFVPKARFLSALVLGLCWFMVHAQLQLNQSWPENRTGETLTVTGTVIGLPERDGERLRFVLAPDRRKDDGLPNRIQVNWFRPLEYLRPGERWEMRLRLDPPTGRLNPGGFDLQRHWLANGIGATAIVQGEATRIGVGGWLSVIDRHRQYLAERLQSETIDLNHAALMRALALADRTALESDLRELLQRTGTAHLLAISGLHIGMVAALAGLIGGWLLSPLLLLHASLDRRRLALLSGLLAGFVYAWLAGFTLPTVRALIMLSVAAAALGVRRGIAPGHALVLALVTVLVIDPLAPLSIGFWLSFSAVAVLIWAFAWRTGQGSPGWFRSLLIAQLAIAVGMLPLNVGVFQQWIPGAVFANLAAIPLVGLWVLPGLLMALLMWTLSLPADWLIAMTEFGLQVLLSLLGWVDAQPWGHRTMPAATTPAILLAMLGALWLIAPPGWPARWLGVLLLLPLLFPDQPSREPSGLYLTVFDVGDGQAILVESAGRRMLLGAGPGDGDGGDAIRRLLSGLDPRLPELSLDGLVVARSHRGHAGGLDTAVSLTHPLRVRTHPGLDYRRCVAGERWSLGLYDLRFLHPSAALPDLGDNSSCVVLIEGPGGSVLFGGGIEAVVERRILLENPNLRSDVLVLSAGGHRRAASAAFLDQLSPNLAIASVGRHDRFGRPHAEVVDRLQERGIDLLETGRCGAIHLSLQSGKAAEVETERGVRRQFWHQPGRCP